MAGREIKTMLSLKHFYLHLKQTVVICQSNFRGLILEVSEKIG